MRDRRRVYPAICSALLLAACPATGWTRDRSPADDHKPGTTAIDREDKATSPSRHDAQNGLRMSRGVVCESIDGYEAYEPLPNAELTSDEKLLVYYRPEGYKTVFRDGSYQAHFTQDAQIRKFGEKAVIRQKKKLLDYNPKNQYPPQNIYLRNTVSLKGLPPGDYELLIILHDELAKHAIATQAVKFRVVPPLDPRQAGDSSQSKDSARAS